MLEVLTAAISIFSGVFFGAYFVARSSVGEAALWGAGAAALAAVVWALVRWQIPAKLPAPEPEEVKDPDADEGGWDVSSAIMAAVVVPIFVILGLLFKGWLLVVIVVAFYASANDPSLLHATVAVVCSITVAVLFEYGVSLPLMKRWGIPR